MPPGTNVTTTGQDGRRHLSPEHRAKVSATAKQRYQAKTAEQRAAQLAALERGRKPRGSAPPGDPPPASGGSTNPLSHTAGDRTTGTPAVEGPKATPGLNGHDGPPRPAYAGPSFEIPDTAPLGPSAPPGEDGQAPPLIAEDGGAPFAASEAEIRNLLALPFEVIAVRRGAHWKIRDDELDIVAPALTRKINEHAAAARVIQAGGDWFVVTAGLGLLVTTRLMEDRDNAERQRAAGARPVYDARTGRVPTAGHNGHGGRPPGSDAGRDGVPHLNGYATGDGSGRPDDVPGDQAVSPAPPESPLIQPL